MAVNPIFQQIFEDFGMTTSKSDVTRETHTIKWVRSGSHDVFGDWEDEQEITFTAEPGDAYGYPILHFVSISPGAGDHGAFSDLAQADLESAAADWLDGDGYDAACAVVCP